MRGGFTLIELIVMMVILGLAFATLPMILGVSARSAGNVADVRGLYHGVAKIQVALSKPWDENNVDDFNTGGGYYVLRTQESDTLGQRLYCDNDRNRSGHYPGLKRRMCENAAATAKPTFTADQLPNDYDDLDDFDNDTDHHVEGYQIQTHVDYVPYVDASPVTMGAAAAGTTNIKHLWVDVLDAANRSLATYHYYAANIGLSQPFIKRNQ